MEGNENKGRFSGLVNGTQKPKPSGGTIAAFVCSICAAALSWMPALGFQLIIIPAIFIAFAFALPKSDCDMRMWTKIIAIVAAAIAGACFMFTFSCMTPVQEFIMM